MRGGFFVSLDETLYQRISLKLLTLGAKETSYPEEETVQYRSPGGGLFTVFAQVPVGTEWEYREGPFRAGPGVILPNMEVVTACPFECRWPRLVAELAGVVAEDGRHTIWILDGDGGVWMADNINPDEIEL